MLELIFFCTMCSLPDAPVAKAWTKPPLPVATHAFYDKPGKIELLAAFTMASADSAMTCHNLAEGGGEYFLPTQHCPQVVALLMGQVAAQEGVAYLLHRSGHHKAERVVRFWSIGANTKGFISSYRDHTE